MNDKPNTFERLVLTMESSQRQDMLRKLAEITELQEDEASLSRINLDDEIEVTRGPESQFLEEPFLVRLWFKILAFFTSSSPNRLYTDYLIENLGKKLDSKYRAYINIRQRSFTDEFYQELFKLKKSQVFFSALLASCENDKAGFIIILASLLIPATCDAIQKTTDPFTVPFEQELKKDIRMVFLRELDSIFVAIPEGDRAKMYQAMQAIEWIRSYCNVPFERIFARFSVLEGSKQTCLLSSVDEEMKELTTVLNSAKRIPVLLLEALFLFGSQEKMGDSKFDIEKECSNFVSRASGHLSIIRQFKTKFQLTDIVRFTINDLTWQSGLIERAEDWFQLFKNAWKKRFEDKWIVWNRLHHKAMLERTISLFLGKEQLPVLQYHPWEGLWLPLFLRRELSLSFLKGLFASVYPLELMKPLKILLIEGDFYRRENLIEYTDAFSILEHQQQQIELFENRLGPKGDIGEGFMLISKDMTATVKGKARLDSLMLSTESDADRLISQTKSAFRSIDTILGGILGVVRGGPYETLINMASIQGKQNERYRKELEFVRQKIRNAMEILLDAETTEKDS